jgi:hypothetical protein
MQIRLLGRQGRRHVREPAGRAAVALDDEMAVPLELARILLPQSLEIVRGPDVAAGDRGGAADRRRALEHEDARAVLAGRRRRGHAGKAGAEYDDVGLRVVVHAFGAATRSDVAARLAAAEPAHRPVTAAARRPPAVVDVGCVAARDDGIGSPPPPTAAPNRRPRSRRRSSSPQGRPRRQIRAAPIRAPRRLREPSARRSPPDERHQLRSVRGRRRAPAVAREKPPIRRRRPVVHGVVDTRSCTSFDQAATRGRRSRQPPRVVIAARLVGEAATRVEHRLNGTARR